MGISESETVVAVLCTRIDELEERVAALEHKMRGMPGPIEALKAKSNVDLNVDLRANPACFGTDPNLMSCECQIIYEALVRAEKQ